MTHLYPIDCAPLLAPLAHELGYCLHRTTARARLGQRPLAVRTVRLSVQAFDVFQQLALLFIEIQHLLHQRQVVGILGQLLLALLQ